MIRGNVTEVGPFDRPPIVSMNNPCGLWENAGEARFMPTSGAVPQPSGNDPRRQVLPHSSWAPTLPMEFSHMIDHLANAVFPSRIRCFPHQRVRRHRHRDRCGSAF